MATKITTRVLADNAVTDAKIADVTLTTATQSASDNTTKIATTAYVTTALANLADSAPATLNTLNELAAALGDDANFSTTVTNSIATKAPLASPSFTGTSLSLKTTSSTANDRAGAGFTATESATDGDRRAIMYLDADNGAFGTGDSGAYFYMEKKGAGGAVSLINQDTSDMYFQTGGAHKRITIKGTGNVGIGTDNPQRELHVQNSSSGATSTGNSVAVFEGNDNTEVSILGGSSSVLALNFGHSGDNNEGMLYFNTTAGSENMQLESSKHITFRAGSANVANNIYFKSYNTDVMTIDGSNNYVGIGETGPAYPLHVDGTNVSSGGGLANLCLVDRTAYNGTNPGAGITFRGEYTSGGNTTNFATIQSVKENASSGNYATALRFTTRAHNANLTEKMRIDSAGKIKIGNNIPMWSGSYGGGLFLKGNNATTDRYARICTVDSTGAAINNGLTVNNDGSTTIDCGQTYSLNVSGNGAGLRFSTGSNQRIYFNTHRAMEGNSDGSIMQIGEGYTQMVVQAREKYSVDGAIYGRVIIRFAASTSGDRLTAITANMNTLLGLSTGQYGTWQVEFGGYAGSGANGCTGSFNIGGYTGHSYSATNHNSYGSGTINVGYSSSSGAATGAGPLSYHPVQNHGMYIANGEVWVYFPAAQQVGIMIKNNSSNALYGTMTVTGTIRN